MRLYADQIGTAEQKHLGRFVTNPRFFGQKIADMAIGYYVYNIVRKAVVSIALKAILSHAAQHTALAVLEN